MKTIPFLLFVNLKRKRMICSHGSHIIIFFLFFFIQSNLFLSTHKGERMIGDIVPNFSFWNSIFHFHSTTNKTLLPSIQKHLFKLSNFILSLFLILFSFLFFFFCTNVKKKKNPSINSKISHNTFCITRIHLAQRIFQHTQHVLQIHEIRLQCFHFIFITK